MHPTTPRSGFTLHYDRVTNILYSDIGIGEAFSPDSGDKPPDIIHFHGLGDTGATNSGITSKVASELNLQPIRKEPVQTASSIDKANIYLVNIYLSNHVAFSGMRVTHANILGADVIVGMDIINEGDFAVTNFEGKTCMHFQISSIREIDFVKEIERARLTKGMSAKKEASSSSLEFSSQSVCASISFWTP